MTFATFDLLAGIVAALLATASRSNRLPIYDSGAWRRPLASCDTGTVAQTLKHVVPNARAGPRQVLGVDVAVIREIVWQHFPLAASCINLHCLNQ